MAMPLILSAALFDRAMLCYAGSGSKKKKKKKKMRQAKMHMRVRGEWRDARRVRRPIPT